MKKLKKSVRATSWALLGAGALTIGAVKAQDAYRVYFANDPVGRNVVSILSQAPLETMLTTTSKIVADIAIDPTNVINNPRAKFEVDMSSLDTGIDLRNEHMRSDKWLDTAKYPRATFTLTKVLSPRRRVRLEAGKSMDGEIEGDLSWHGITRPVRAKVHIDTVLGTEATKKRLEGDIIHVRAEFPLQLDQFGVKVPEMAKMEIANVQQVTIDVFSSTGSPKPTIDGGATAETTTEATTTQATTTAATKTTQAITEKKPMNPNELQIEDIKVGDGAEAKAGQKVTVHYRGTLQNGTEFDASYNRNAPFTFNLGAGEVIKGWDQGVAGMKVGGKRKLTIPPALGYGARGAGGVIPPNATLNFDVELLGVE